MRKVFLKMLLITAMVMALVGLVSADTIMFPYINENPGNVSTLISVINGDSAIGSPVTTLHYRYITKPATAAALDVCAEWDFFRPTSENDIVTFDASGTINNGQAMFGDPGAGFISGTSTQITYNAGSNAPYFHDITTPKPRRGYLLVTQAAGLNGPELLSEGNLDGEAILFDIVNGAAWGYKAALNNSGNFDFRSSTDVLVEDGYSFYDNTVIFPPNQFTTRYFVTPLAINTNLSNNYNMTLFGTNQQKRTRFGLYGWGPTVGMLGVFDRNEQFGSGGALVHVRCVAGIELQSLIGSANYTWLTPTGGWATVDLLNPSVIAAEGETAVNADSYDAFVYDLKYGNFTGYQGMINHGTVIRSGR